MTTQKLLTEIFLNFWYWWYGEQFGAVLHSSKSAVLKVGWQLGLLTQFYSFTQPLYRDYSALGRVVSFLIRSLWILVTLPIWLVAIVALGLLCGLYLVLPLLPLVQVWKLIAQN